MVIGTCSTLHFVDFFYQLISIRVLIQNDSERLLIFYPDSLFTYFLPPILALPPPAVVFDLILGHNAKKSVKHFQMTASDGGGRKPKSPCLLILPVFVAKENKNDNNIHTADRQVS